MKNGAAFVRWVLVTAVIYACAGFPLSLNAQAPSYSACPGSTYWGDKYIWQSSGSNATYCDYHDYVDVSNVGDGNDVCKAINDGLNALGTDSSDPYEDGGIIDARGVPPSSSSFACTTNPFPSGGSKIANATILLPAGTIPLGASWVLPPNTRIIGEGPTVTILKASSGITGALLFMGDQYSGNNTSPTCSGDCNGISIEHLGLNGNNTSSLDGIDNYFAQELNYVNDVTLTNMGASGVGLNLFGNIIVGGNPEGANNSGPYTNITYSGKGTCLSINGTNNTRGVNGLHCTYTGSSTIAAVLLDASNNMLQNVVLTSYTGDGIAIGKNATARNNVLVNVSAPNATSVVNIYTTGSPQDLTLLGISGGTTNVINDQVTSSTIPSTSSPVSAYILGEPICSNSSCSTILGHSRFTGSEHLPAWFQGSTVPGSSNCGGSSGNGGVGSLYSLVSAYPGTSSGSGVATLWGCIGTGWVDLSNLQ